MHSPFGQLRYTDLSFMPQRNDYHANEPSFRQPEAVFPHNG